LALALLAAFGLTLFANQQRRQALTAYSLSLAANAGQALADQDSGTALVLALAANRIPQPPPQSQRILLSAAYAPGARSRNTLAALFPGVVGPATCLAFSPDGTKILVGLADGKLVLWEPATGSHQFLNGYNGRVNAVAISPDGATALSAGWDHQVVYWDLHTGAIIHRMGNSQAGHSGVVRAVAFSPDGKTAVSGGLAGDSILNPGELILWNLESGQEMRSLHGHTNGVVAAAFTPDGKGILASSGDSEIVIEGEKVQGSNATYDVILWDAESGSLKAKYPDVGHDVFSLAISPDGKRALLGSYYNRSITLLDLSTGKVLSTLTGHANAVRAVAFLPGGQQALSAGDDNTLILWNLATAKPLVIFKAGESGQLALAVQPDGRSALSSTRDGEIFRWDLQDAAVIQRLVGHNDAIFDVDYSPGGQKALSCSGGANPGMPAQDASLRLWDLQSGGQLLRMASPVQVIFQCAVSPDGRQALSGSEDGLVRLWDLETAAEIRELKGHNDWVISMAFTPDSKQALTGSKDGSLILWNLKEDQPVRKMYSAAGDNWSLAISPDGKKALTDAAQGGAIYWDLATGTEIRRLRRSDVSEKPGVSGIAFLPDGKSAITGEDDGYVIQWDLQTGKEFRRFGRHEGIRTRVEVSRDGKTLLTSGMDGVLRLWDLESGELVREFGYPAPAVIFDIKISPDGQTALSGSIDQMVTQWSLSKPSLKELTDWIAANRYVRELTCAERARYQIEPLCAAK
jgi:WD40 repeat protein